MRRLLAFITIAATAKISFAETTPRFHCKTVENAGACSFMHGRLAVYNGGAPNFRLWQIGKGHLYGIFTDKQDMNCTRALGQCGRKDEENPELPRNLEKAFDVQNPLEVRVYADFEVCPLEPHIPGHMQAACIESATHVFVKRD